jgi:integrase
MSTLHQSDWLTSTEAGAYLKVKPRTIVRWAPCGSVPAHRLSGTGRITWRFGTELWNRALDGLLKDGRVGRFCREARRRFLLPLARAIIPGIGSVFFFRHSRRRRNTNVLDAVGTTIAVQQKLMRHADIRTTMNVYGTVVTDEMTVASSKVAGLAVNGAQTERKAS